MSLSPIISKYESYKDSGVEWLGEIPEEWDVIRFKNLFIEINKRSKDGSENLLSVSQYTGVTKKSDKLANGALLTNAESLDGYKKVSRGDLVSNIMLAWNGSLGFSSFDGITSPAYSIYRIKSNNIVEKYAHFLLRTDLYKSEFKRNSSGVIDSRLRLYTDDFFNIFSIIPPVEEQISIANFLDKKTVQIDQAITIKQQQIERLKERKKILIQKAVTQGLNPNVPLRDSGVEWIGEIPEYWVVKRAKYLFGEINERSQDGAEELLSVSHLTGVTPRSEKKISMFMAEDYTGSKTCRKNDLVFNIMWAWMGALGVSGQSGIVSPSYGVFRQRSDKLFNSIFLELLLKSNKYIEHYNKVSTGLHSSRLRFYGHMFFNMELGFPSFEEQNKIIESLGVETSKINQAITLQQSQIEKFKEYKTTLINSAVTGKIKITTTP